MNRRTEGDFEFLGVYLYFPPSGQLWYTVLWHVTRLSENERERERSQAMAIKTKRLIVGFFPIAYIVHIKKY